MLLFSFHSVVILGLYHHPNISSIQEHKAKSNTDCVSTQLTWVTCCPDELMLFCNEFSLSFTQNLHLLNTLPLHC